MDFPTVKALRGPGISLRRTPGIKFPKISIFSKMEIFTAMDKSPLRRFTPPSILVGGGSGSTAEWQGKWVEFRNLTYDPVPCHSSIDPGPPHDQDRRCVPHRCGVQIVPMCAIEHQPLAVYQAVKKSRNLNCGLHPPRVPWGFRGSSRPGVNDLHRESLTIHV